MTKADRDNLGQVVIEYITARTESGYDKNGEKFEPYSQDYAQLKGVSRSDVDLILSGEMLSELRLVSSSPRELVIGYKGVSSELVGKIEGNILGTYGKSSPVTKGRDFLGIDEADLEVLIDSIGELEDEEIDIDEIARQAARDIIGDIDFES